MVKTFQQYLILITACLCFVFLGTVNAFCQTDPILKNYLNSLNTALEKTPIEKAYLQLDKPYYTLGDTIRFKSYLFNGAYLTPSAKSGLLYVELDNANNQPVKRVVYPVVSGLSWGDIALDEKIVPEGSYTIRAYTNWMLNFGEDYVFKKEIYISALNSSTLIRADFKLDSTAQKNKIQATLHFASLNNSPLMLKDMQLRLMNGFSTQTKYKASTGVDGTVILNFDLADKTPLKNFSIKAHQTGKGVDTSTLTIPIILNRSERADVQFMPEGGNLVAGIRSKIGFKAISEDGNSIFVTGKIYDSKQQAVATFQSIHNGMGAFALTPLAGESYSAKIDLPNGVTKNYLLPQVNATGTALKILSADKDSLELTLSATPNLVTTSNNEIYVIIAQARGVVCYAASFELSNTVIKKKLSKSLFPTGIVHFTLLNSKNQPLNERLVYVDHKDNLQITVSPNKLNYGTRDSIALTIQVNDKRGKPVQGAFALAVTDDSQVKIDSASGNLVNNLLFTSDLKGNIEDPGYYFRNPDLQKETELDNLLLTQGWVGYSWKDVFDPAKTEPKYRPETEFAIQGKVTNLFNKPVKQEEIMLMRKHPFEITDTITNNDGRFVFKRNGLLPTDSAFFLLQAKNKRQKNADVHIEVDEIIPPVFKPLARQKQPWYVNSDTVLLNNSHIKAAQQKAEADYQGTGRMLKEVVVNNWKVIPGSRVPHPDDDDVIYDEKDMATAGKMTFLQFLQHKYQVQEKWSYYLMRGHFKIVLIVDGMDCNKDDLEYLTAEDIKGIEIQYIITPGKLDFAYTYVTTYAGNGKYIKHAPGNYVYKPIPFTAPKEFYKPRYTVKNKTTAIGTDLRSTIHWEPNIITDKDGKATVSFFSADKNATYSVVVEGTDLKGNLGYQKGEITVGPVKLVNAELHQKATAQ